MHASLRTAFTAVALAAAALGTTAAHAGSSTLTLVRASLNNASDSGGLWQHEGGTIKNAAGTAVGTYIVTRRVTTGGSQLYNTAATTTTLFFPPSPAGNAPPNITLEGSHSYTSGNFFGSVAAASSSYHWVIGADAAATIPVSGTTKLVITWLGSSTLHLP